MKIKVFVLAKCIEYGIYSGFDGDMRGRKGLKKLLGKKLQSLIATGKGRENWRVRNLREAQGLIDKRMQPKVGGNKETSQEGFTEAFFDVVRESFPVSVYTALLMRAAHRAGDEDKIKSLADSCERKRRSAGLNAKIGKKV